jgi:ADP-heptose:LPS heptosyltransferase
MRVDLQRWLDQLVGPSLCRVLSLLTWWRRQPVTPGQPEKILVILLSEMGSLVLAQPMFQRLQQKYPDASLYVLLFRQNQEVLELLQVVPQAHILSVRSTSLFRLVWDSLIALRTMWRLGIDTVIDCELFSRVSSIYALLSGARIRVGFHPHTQEGLYRGNFINRPVLYNPYQHISQQFLTLAEAIDSTATPTVKRRVDPTRLSLPPMAVGAAELAALTRRLQSDFPALVGKRLVLLYAGGGLLPIRAWPLAYYCQVAANVIRQGYSVGVIGLRQEKDGARAIQTHCDSPYCFDLTGYTSSVRELMLLFHLAALLITNDGGPAHFAALTPIPTMVLYGPETPTLYGRLDDKAVNLYTPLSCSPCLTAYNHRFSPCDGDNVCLKSIPPALVLQRAYELLAQDQRPILQQDTP